MLAKEQLLITLAFFLLLGPTSFAQGANGRTEPEVAAIRLDKDNIRVTTSVKVKPGTYRVEDTDKNGVLQIDADAVTVDFQGATLWGVLKGEERNRFEGVGISINGHQNVTIKNARVHGFRYNIQAKACQNLVIEKCDVAKSRALRMYKDGKAIHTFLALRSLAAWRAYGAGIWLEACTQCTVRKCTGRSGQNGILLVNSQRCVLRENDFSFSSGWGIGLWHSSGNKILANYINFVDRVWGSSWGGDAQAIVVVSGSNANWVVANSLSHGGFFLANRTNRSNRIEDGACNHNIIAYNDCSYVHANSLESTFSDGNIFVRNLANHSNYGFWLGFSTNNLVLENQINGNRTNGIAVEYGSGTVIEGNAFSKNGQSAIALWGTDPKRTKQYPSKDYVIRRNTFTEEKNGVVLTGTTDTTLEGNRFSNPLQWAIVLDRGAKRNTATKNMFEIRSQAAGVILSKNDADRIDASENYWNDRQGRDPGSLVTARNPSAVKTDPTLPNPPPAVRLSASEQFWESERGEGLTRIYNEVKGSARFYKDTPFPKGWHLFRPDDWSPFDFTKEAIYPNTFSSDGTQTLYVLRKGPFQAEQVPDWIKVSPASGTGPTEMQVGAEKAEPGEGETRSFRFQVKFTESGDVVPVSGTLTRVGWDVKFFTWKGIGYEDRQGWEKVFKGKPIYRHTGPRLDLSHGNRPAQVPGSHFAMLAEAEVDFPGGDVFFDTISDDGLRLYVDGKEVIADWTRHGPKPNSKTINLSKGKHAIRVEFCQDGGAMRLLVHWKLLGK